MENEYPLILVFYLDGEIMRQREIITPFVESVNQMISSKNSNVMAFFLPTNEKERIECINPTIISKPDMEKINKMVKDIETQFSVNADLETLKEEDNIVLDNPCECGGNGNCKCNTND